MTRKDYVKIAGALAEANAEVDSYIMHPDERRAAKFAVEGVEIRLSAILANDSPAFDRSRFHAAAIGQLERRSTYEPRTSAPRDA